MVLQLFPTGIVDIAGGREAVLKVVEHFYFQLSFKDPLLSVLYHDKTLAHHERFCKWFFSASGLDDEYEKEGGMKLLLSKHDEAKSCPLREESGTDPRCGKIGDGFTKAQRNRWLKYQLDACQHFNLPREFTEPYIRGLTVFMNAYGPWTDNRDGVVVELMEQEVKKKDKMVKRTLKKTRSASNHSQRSMRSMSMEDGHSNSPSSQHLHPLHTPAQIRQQRRNSGGVVKRTLSKRGVSMERMHD